MSFDAIKVNTIRTELNKTLEDLGVKIGVKFEVGSIRYDENSFRSSFKAFDISGNKDYEQIEFEKSCEKFNIPKDWYGKNVTINNNTRGTYIVSGIASRAKKYPVLLKNISTGKVDVKMSISAVKKSILLTEKE